MEQGGEIHPDVADDMHVDHVVCDLINDPVRTGDCLSKLDHVQLAQLVDLSTGIREFS